MEPSSIIVIQKGKLNKTECENIMSRRILNDEYITILDASYNCDRIYDGLYDYLNYITKDSPALTTTLKGDMFIQNMFIEKYSNTEYKQLVNVNYENKYYNFIMGVVMIDPGIYNCEITVFNRHYLLEKGDIIWFPASWCYPFSEKYGEETYSLKIIINKLL